MFLLMIEHATGLFSQTPIDIGMIQELEEKKEAGKKEDKKDEKLYASFASLHRSASVYNKNYLTSQVTLPATPVIDYLTPPPDKTQLI